MSFEERVCRTLFCTAHVTTYLSFVRRTLRQCEEGDDKRESLSKSAGLWSKVLPDHSRVRFVEKYLWTIAIGCDCTFLLVPTVFNRFDWDDTHCLRKSMFTEPQSDA